MRVFRAVLCLLLLFYLGVPIAKAQSANTISEPTAVGVFYSLDSTGTQHPLENKVGELDSLLASFSVQGNHSTVRFPADTNFKFLVRLPPEMNASFFQYAVDQGLRRVTTKKVDNKFYLTSGAKLQFASEHIGNSSFVLTPQTPLGPGEYCFGTTKRNDVYCFGVDAPNGVSEASSRASGNRGDPDIDNFDIVGLNLNMSPEQVRHTILKQHPLAKDTKLDAGVSTPYFSSQLMVVGELFNIEPYVFVGGRQDYADSGYMMQGEVIEIIYAPGANDLLGIFRFKAYRTGSFPTFDSTIKALVQKYGEPTVSDSHYERASNALTWVARADINRGEAAGFVFYNRSGSPGACSMQGLASGNRYLYETTVTDRNLGAPGNGSTGELHRGFVKQSFIDVFNNIETNNKAYSNCGTVFMVDTVRASNRDYVSDVAEKVVDFDRANSELLPVVKAFYKNSEDARDKKVKKDSSNAPTF